MLLFYAPTEFYNSSIFLISLLDELDMGDDDHRWDAYAGV